MYYPFQKEIKMGAHWHSSCLDMNYSLEVLSKLTGLQLFRSSKRYDIQSIAQQSMKSVKLKAYGKESGNWIGVEAIK